MWNVYKQKLQLLMSFEEVISLLENDEKIPDENWNDVRDGLLAFGLPPENILIDCVADLRVGKMDRLGEFREYFDRFLEICQCWKSFNSVVALLVADDIAVYWR